MPIRAWFARSWFRFLRPLLLDFYILGEVTGPFVGGVLFIVFILLMFQLLRLADFFIIHGVSIAILGKMVCLMVLSFLPFALPFAFLVGILVGFGRLSADSELVAMKANGISIFRLSIPAVMLSIVVLTLSLALTMEWVPWGERTLKSTIIKINNTKAVSAIKEGTFTSGFFDLLIFADHIDPKTNRMRHVFIYDEREAKNVMTIVADEGEILPVRAQSELGASAVLRLYNGNIHSNNPGNSAYQKIDFGQYQLFLKVDEGADNATVKPRMYPYGELAHEIEKAKEKKDTSRMLEFEAEMWRRYALAWTPLVFVFLGVGFGTVRTRAVRAGALMISVVVIAFYWAIQAWATVSAQRGQIPPLLAMQLPNLIMSAVAVKAYRTAIW